MTMTVFHENANVIIDFSILSKPYSSQVIISPLSHWSPRRMEKCTFTNSISRRVQYISARIKAEIRFVDMIFVSRRLKDNHSRSVSQDSRLLCGKKKRPVKYPVHIDTINQAFAHLSHRTPVKFVHVKTRTVAQFSDKALLNAQRTAKITAVVGPGIFSASLPECGAMALTPQINTSLDVSSNFDCSTPVIIVLASKFSPSVVLAQSLCPTALTSSGLKGKMCAVFMHIRSMNPPKAPFQFTYESNRSTVDSSLNHHIYESLVDVFWISAYS